MGAQAAKLLLERIAQQDLEPRQEILDTELVIRGSTAVVLQPAGEMNS
jgi:DNA-binding LacI/PurR family transcriptional regulator